MTTKNQFAKIFDNVSGYQVLVKKQVSNDGDYEFSSSVWDNDNEYKNTYSYEDDFDRDAAYDMFDSGMAKEFVNAMGSFIKLVN